MRTPLAPLRLTVAILAIACQENRSFATAPGEYSATRLLVSQGAQHYPQAFSEEGRPSGYMTTGSTSMPFSHGVVWDLDGQPQPQPVPGAYEAAVVHGFDAGNVPLGVVRYPGGSFGVPVVWRPDGLQQLPAPEQYGFAKSGNGTTIVGTVIDTLRMAEQACIWEDGTIRLLDLPGTISSRAVSINADGIYVGTARNSESLNVGLIGQNGSAGRLNYPAFPRPSPLEINDEGWFTGVYRPEDSGRRGFLARAFSDEIYSLDILPGYFEAIAQGINNDRTVVGSVRGSGDWERALIWPNGSPTPIDLNDYVDVPGVTFIQGLDINNAGQILAEGRLDGGGFAYYVLTPVPEPGAAALGAAGLVALRRRR